MIVNRNTAHSAEAMGEALQGSGEFGIDPAVLDRMAQDWSAG